MLDCNTSGRYGSPGKKSMGCEWVKSWLKYLRKVLKPPFPYPGPGAWKV
jgi:hypothetical protein